MEITLSQPSTTQADVTVNGHFSHSFDPRPLFPPAGKEGRPPEPPPNPKTYGETLYRAIFRTDSLAAKTPLARDERIVLVMDDGLQGIFWEYAHDGNDYMVLDHHFVRGLPAAEQPSLPSPETGLHILAVPSDPLDKSIAALKIDAEWQHLVDTIQELTNAVTLERVRPATVDRLGKLLAGKHDRVLHFMGHGISGLDEAGLLFENEFAAPDAVRTRDFVRSIRDRVFLVTLNACVSATPGLTEFSNLAAALVRQNIPYALGMRFSIFDTDARAFSKVFYEQLANGESVEEALRLARIKLARGDRAWVVGVPVLYTCLDAAAPGFSPADGIPTIRDYQPPMELSALPRAEGVFQGRTEELKGIGYKLTGDDRARIFTIHGGGGQGKTALAREAVERFGWAWPGGVWAISLENLPSRTTFVTDLARFLNLPVQELAPADLERAVLQQVGQRRLLIVLDNAETLVEAVRSEDAEALALADFIKQGILTSRQVSALVTSRDFLGWPNEEGLDLGGLLPEEGEELFRQNAPQRKNDISSTLATELSRKVDGQPLSLRLLGAAFNESAISLDEFVAQHEEQLIKAENIYIGPDHRQRKLYASIDTSVRYLTDDLRAILSGLWVFQSPFMPETAQIVLTPEGEETEDDSRIAEGLNQLWRRGLLVKDEQTLRDGTVLLYRLLPTVRPYAERYLQQAYERDTLLKRFGLGCAVLVRLIKNELDRSASLVYVAQQVSEDLVRGLAYLQYDPEGYGYALLRLGQILRRLGDRKRAMEFSAHVLALAQGQNLELETRALNNLALAYSNTGQPEKALELYERALLIDRKVRDRSSEATTLNNMADVYRNTGHLGKALELFEQSLSIKHEIGDRDSEATTLINMAIVYRASGQQGKARELCEQALPIMREIGDRMGEASALNNLAAVYFYHETGQLEKVLELYVQVLSIMREIGNRDGEAIALNNLAMVYNAMEQPGEALKLYEQALPIMHEVGNRAAEAATLNNMGYIFFQRGEPERTVDTLRQVIEIDVQIGARASEVQALYNLAVVLRNALGREAEAMQQAEHALAILLELNLPHTPSGLTQQELQDFLARSPGGLTSASARTMPPDQIRTIITGTVAVMTTRKDIFSEWRDAIAESLKEAQEQGADWQIEVDFYTEVLAVLDGGTPSLPEDHPYASALLQIQQGIAQGGLPQEQSEGEKAFALFVQTCVLALKGDAAQKQQAYDLLGQFAAQLSDPGMQKFIRTVQKASLDGKASLAVYRDEVDDEHQPLWDTIMQQVSGNSES